MYMRGAAIIILLLAGAGMAQGVSSLTVGDATYENVTLKNEYPRSFFIQHDGGTAFIERSKLSEEQIADLLGIAGNETPAVEQPETEPEASPTPEAELTPEPEPEPEASTTGEAGDVGQEAADMRLIDAEQKETSLSALRGKVVLLNFNLAEGGCNETCIPDFAILAELKEKHKGDPFEVVSVLTSFEDQTYESVLQERAISWKTSLPYKLPGRGGVTPEKLRHLEPLGGRNEVSAIFKAYGVDMLATNVVVDKNGTIVGHFSTLNGGRQDVEAAIAKALAN
jgi:hypothetical protein